MHTLIKSLAITTLLGTSLLLSHTLNAQESTDMKDGMSDDAAAKMMEQMAKHTGLSSEHDKLAEFIGEWDVTIKMVMPGAPAQSWQASATSEWLINGRWVGTRIKGLMFGQPYESFSMHGFDTYAKAYVTATVSSMDNALNVTRGVKVDPEDKVRVEYGVLQEYLTGELYKPFRTVTRLQDKDNHSMEVWDMGIGADGAMVLEFSFKRKGS